MHRVAWCALVAPIALDEGRWDRATPEPDPPLQTTPRQASPNHLYRCVLELHLRRRAAAATAAAGGATTTTTATATGGEVHGAVQGAAGDADAVAATAAALAAGAARLPRDGNVGPVPRRGPFETYARTALGWLYGAAAQRGGGGGGGDVLIEAKEAEAEAEPAEAEPAEAEAAEAEAAAEAAEAAVFPLET